MRKIQVNKIVEIVKKLSIETNCFINEDIVSEMSNALKNEKSLLAKDVIKTILNNHKIAKNKIIPTCQDTGTAVVFLEIGEKVCFTGGNIIEAINNGVKKGYKEGYLRKSIVIDPFDRKNTNDNTPAIIHIEIVKGNKLKITFAAKGAGSENMSTIKMFNPGIKITDIEDFIIDWISKSASNACPPIVIGIGIGGNFETSALLAKKALLKPINYKNINIFYQNMEKRILQKVNNLGIGPQGFGGKTTALAVHINNSPCHIASLPVAINIDCHINRHKSVII